MKRSIDRGHEEQGTHDWPISIDDEKVDQLMRTISSLRVAPDFAAQVAPRVDASPEARLRATLWAAAICHSTKGGLRGRLRGREYNGWDYLLFAFLLAAELDEATVSPERVSAMDGERLYDLLTAHGEDPHVTLSDLPRRAEILRESAAVLRVRYGGSVTELLVRANHQLGGAHGAYQCLAELNAFRDPLHKKSSAFLMTAYFSGLWRIDDFDNVVPMIDYHRLRLLCRTGCIRVEDPELLQDLLEQREVGAEIGEAFRATAAEICRRIARAGRLPVFDFDVLLWAHARSCCRHRPVCAGDAPENSSFYDLLEESFSGRCVFQDWCPGAGDVRIRGIWEPAIRTELY